MPGLIIGGVIVFYLIVWVLHIPIDQLRADGWLLAAIPCWRRMALSLEQRLSGAG